jgi:hypothetical protein
LLIKLFFQKLLKKLEFFTGWGGAPEHSGQSLHNTSSVFVGEVVGKKKKPAPGIVELALKWVNTER